MAASHDRGSTTPAFGCSWCGGAAEDEQSLLDHQAWCLGDAVANTRLLNEVAEHDGELTQEALVAAARKRREHSGDRSAKR